MQRSHLARAAFAACAISASAWAQAVSFDPNTPIGSPPVVLTSTSGLGSLTVNVNSYSMNTGNADYPGIPYPVQLFMSDSRFMVAQYAGFDAVATPSGAIDISSNSFYAGKAATAVFSNGTSPGPVRASFALQLAAQFNSPSDVGLQIELKGGQYLDTSNLLFINGVWSSKCGVGCFTPVNFVTPTYHLTLTGRTDTGDTVTLVDETRTSTSFDDVITTALGGHLTGLSGSLELTNNPTGYRYYLGSISLSPTSAVPEPASGSLWWLAIPGLVVAVRRRR